MDNGIWKCPNNGLYRISVSAISSTSGDNLRSSDIWIYKNQHREAGAKYFNSTYDDVHVITLSTDVILSVSKEDTIHATGRIVVSEKSNRYFNRTATFGGRGTILLITRII